MDEPEPESEVQAREELSQDLWSTFCPNMTDSGGPDPMAVLDEARSAFYAKNYEAALEKLVWFHQNAERLDPGTSAVRRSFGMSFWVELADQYPPAKDLLISNRNRIQGDFLDGAGAQEAFRDLASMNGYLGERGQTYDIFLKLHAERPALARDCFPFAELAVVEAEDWPLFLRYAGDLRLRVKQRSQRLDQALSRATRLKKGRSRFMRRWAEVRNCAQDHFLVFRVLRHSGRGAEVGDLRKTAIGSVQDSAGRDDLDEELSVLEAGGPGRFPKHDDEGNVIGLYVPEDDDTGTS